MKRVLAMLGAVCAVLPLSAEIGPPTDIPSRARGAARIVVARVADVRAQFATNRFGDQLIVSTVVIDIDETLKGSAATSMEVEVEGGTVGDLTLKVSDLPRLVPGERAVFFLDNGGGTAQVPHGRGKGILRLSADDRVDSSALTLGELRRQIQAAIGGGR